MNGASKHNKSCLLSKRFFFLYLTYLDVVDFKKKKRVEERAKEGDGEKL